tara:strand:- start:602615 stop:603814 length:1200 start_codon:yes stop_codon:yes gene_type:complete
MYKKIKKQNGEKFAQRLRDFHNGIMEIPDLDVILRHAGRDAAPLLPYLLTLLATDDDPEPEPEAIGSPFELLEQAGYKAFHADTLEKQNSIKTYYKKGELLCTFNDSARYQKYHIVHAIKNDVDNIRREAFNGKEERQDDYGTSVISIQMNKQGGFISIKNRYNHSVDGCDHTFDSNPDNIITGLSAALKDHFNVNFSASVSLVPRGFVLMGEQIFQYYREQNNIYYADNSWAEDAEVFTVNKSAGDALFDGFLFDNKSKSLKNIDPNTADSFADDFNKYYGGNSGLNVHKGNLVLDGAVLIGAEHSQIRTLSLPEFKTLSDGGISRAPSLTHIDAAGLIIIGKGCLRSVPSLTHIEAPALTNMGKGCLRDARSLKRLAAPALTGVRGLRKGIVRALIL